MGKRISTFIITFVAWIAVFILQKPLFMLAYNGKLPSDCGFMQYLEVIYHGLPLDLSLAGYLTCLPALLLIASVWIKKDIVKAIMNVYIVIAAMIVAVSFCINIGLYEYWGFPLDATPVFYFLSSPKDAMASMTIPMAIGGIVGIIAITALISWILIKLIVKAPFSGFGDNHPGGNRIVTSVVLLVLSGLLFIPIRGGFTVSTTNTGKAYFSEKAILNHAAVNPLFSFIESMSHQEDFASQYRFMGDKKANEIFAKMSNTSSEGNTIKLKSKRPDIYLFVLESFSMELWKTPAVPNLKEIATEGLFFENFYANSFRTDRGLVAVLGGFPAQPTMSIMKYPKKTAKLPSIAAQLKKNGYDLKYYYGGDADFTNMRSYLVGQGFEDIVSDVDFPVKERMSKWGVPDDKVFARLLTDLNLGQNKKPMFRVLQTSSSHEPFDVPYHKLADESLNAFAYTDSCVGDFIKKLKASDRWENSLVIIVPDHLGCWPKNINNDHTNRYHIPLIWTGGAIAAPEKIAAIGSQQDIAATLLGQLGIDHSEFIFSKDILCPTTPHFAFFTNNDLFGVVSDDNAIVHDNKLQKTVVNTGKMKDANLEKGKAYLQKLYDYISEL